MTVKEMIRALYDKEIDETVAEIDDTYYFGVVGTANQPLTLYKPNKVYKYIDYNLGYQDNYPLYGIGYDGSETVIHSHASAIMQGTNVDVSNYQAVRFRQKQDISSTMFITFHK